MGRESRQARRARERRQQERTTAQTKTNANRYSLIAGGAIAAVILLVVASLAFSRSGGKTSASDQATATATAQYTPVPGLVAGPVHCYYNEMTGSGFYHVHAGFTLLVQGKHIKVPNQIGSTDRDCLYALHTHTPSDDVLHIESPYKIIPSLGNFFQIWGQPLSSTRVARYALKPGQKMKMFVNEKPYRGDPAAIPLKSHTHVTIEIGPPFPPPKKFPFAKLNL